MVYHFLKNPIKAGFNGELHFFVAADILEGLLNIFLELLPLLAGFFSRRQFRSPKPLYFGGFCTGCDDIFYFNISECRNTVLVTFRQK